jgi:hypothetical protein
MEKSKLYRIARRTSRGHHSTGYFLLPKLRHDPGLLHLLPQVGELGRRFAGYLASFASHWVSPFL